MLDVIGLLGEKSEWRAGRTIHPRSKASSGGGASGGLIEAVAERAPGALGIDQVDGDVGLRGRQFESVAAGLADHDRRNPGSVGVRGEPADRVGLAGTEEAAGPLAVKRRLA